MGKKTQIDLNTQSENTIKVDEITTESTSNNSGSDLEMVEI